MEEVTPNPIIRPDTHHAYRRRLYHIVRKLKPGPIIKGAEVGVYRGELSAFLLSKFAHLHLYMIDLWAEFAPEHSYRTSNGRGDPLSKQTDEEQEANCREALARVQPWAVRTTVLRSDSVAAAKMMREQLGRESLDFAFIDGDHSAEGTQRDIDAYWPLIRPGGILAGHDYGGPGRCRGVKPVVNAFVEREGLPLEVWKGRVWWTRKPGHH